MDESSVVSRIAHESCLRAPPLLARGHWWEELDRDFARRPEGFDLADPVNTPRGLALDNLEGILAAATYKVTFAQGEGFLQLRARKVDDKWLVEGFNISV